MILLGLLRHTTAQKSRFATASVHNARQYKVGAIASRNTNKYS